uniref:Uncharacterized protein n=1 Tax=Pyricularia oryzae ourmia-like virus 3 associated RNA TaxID=2291944 RepID=A0A3Q9WT88_9VIRU|nr:hypothetical protein [Pyricularia oryzae ourmia-like virus 3 associated RNA]
MAGRVLSYALVVATFSSPKERMLVANHETSEGRRRPSTPNSEKGVPGALLLPA